MPACQDYLLSRGRSTGALSDDSCQANTANHLHCRLWCSLCTPLRNNQKTKCSPAPRRCRTESGKRHFVDEVSDRFPNNLLFLGERTFEGPSTVLWAPTCLLHILYAMTGWTSAITGCTRLCMPLSFAIYNKQSNSSIPTLPMLRTTGFAPWEGLAMTGDRYTLHGKLSEMTWLLVVDVFTQGLGPSFFSSAERDIMGKDYTDMESFVDHLHLSYR